MYNIYELKEMEVEQLRSVAAELEVKGYEEDKIISIHND